MRRAPHIMQVIFWTSVPLFAVYLAVSWGLGELPLEFDWPGVALWCVVVVSSGFLTVKVGLPRSSLEEGRELPKSSSAGATRRASEWLVYAVILYLAAYLHSSQLGFFF